MIVDSPGVGESEVMDEFVVKYMPNAFCFIYVINSGNAGGVQKDRVSTVLALVTTATTATRKYYCYYYYYYYYYSSLTSPYLLVQA